MGKSMATYQEILKEVLSKENRWVHTCWIAHVKEMNGLNRRKAPNRFPGKARANPCPEWARPLIEKAMKRFGVLRAGERTRGTEKIRW